MLHGSKLKLRVYATTWTTVTNTLLGSEGRHKRALIVLVHLYKVQKQAKLNCTGLQSNLNGEITKERNNYHKCRTSHTSAQKSTGYKLEGAHSKLLLGNDTSFLGLMGTCFL